MTIKGTQLLARDVAELAFNGGWKNYITLCDAVAICSAESSRYPEADNTDKAGNPTNPDGTTDYGLWQVNSIHVGKTIGLYKVTVEVLLDPVANAKIAHALYIDAGGWTPWAAYNSGAHMKHMAGAIKGIQNFGLLHFGLPIS